jgi:hypothetical protein
LRFDALDVIDFTAVVDKLSAVAGLVVDEIFPPPSVIRLFIDTFFFNLGMPD